jgi:CBS domain-containing protein
MDVAAARCAWHAGHARIREASREVVDAMNIGQIMTRDVETVTSDAAMQQAAERMLQRGVGALPVTDDGHVVGFLTDRDLVVRGLALGRDARTTPVSEVMTQGAIACFDEDDVAECARKMIANGVRRIVVLNSADRLAGIVSLDDIAARGEEPALGGEVLEEVARPTLVR